MDFGQRLRNLRLERGMTQQELADAIGASVVGVRNWERGTRKPTMEMLVSLSRALRVSIDTLVGLPVLQEPNCSFVLTPAERTLLKNYQALDRYGRKTVDTVCRLEKERVDESARRVLPKVVEFPTPKPSDRFIPRYTTPSAAGFNVPLDGADFEMILVDDSVPEDADYAVDIQGNSMAPYIHDGDMVFVKKDTELSVGDVGIFCVDGAMYCKQYYLADDGTLMLVSANPELRHTNIVLSPDSGSEVRACGKVLMSRRVELPDYLFED